jgi:WD40 repeat protein
MASYSGLRLEPVSALGLSVLENGALHWNASRQLFYAVGAHIRHMHLETTQTQFLFPERFQSACAEIIKICDLAASSNGQFLAISEIFRPNHGILSIYDFETQVAHAHLRYEGENAVHRFSSMAFSHDSAMIAALGHSLVDTRVFVWKMGRQVALGGAFAVPASVRAVAFDPQDAFRLFLFGTQYLAIVLVNTIDKAQRKIEVPGVTTFDCFAFVPGVTGLLLVSSGPSLIVILNDSVVEVTQPIQAKIDILASVRHFVFLISNGIVHLFKANQTEPFLTSVGPVDLHISNVTEFSPSPDGDLAVILYDEGLTGLLDVSVAFRLIKQQVDSTQSHSVRLPKEQEEELNQFMEEHAQIESQTQSAIVDAAEMQQFIGLFSPLHIRYHIGPIVAVATCPRKPLLATCGGQDRTLLVWNLSKRGVIASEKLSEPVNSCSFHPSGDLLAVGTSEKLLLYSLTFDRLVLRQKWENLSCTCVSFSNGGHLLAAGSLIIKVVATYTAKTVASLRGHNLSVKSIAWAPNDAFFVSSGLDGNVFKWSAKTWDRYCECSLPYQCLSAILSTVIGMDDKNNQVTTHHILVATSNSSLYDLDLDCERFPNKRGMTMTAATMPVNFSLVSGDQRGNLQVIPYPLLPAGEENPFHIGTEVAVHTGQVHCVLSSSDGQSLFTTSEDSSIFIFNVVQPHQMVVAGPVALALSREEQSFLIQREAFEEKQDTMMRLREMMNLHRSQFQCAKTKLSEQQTRGVVQQKNKWQMTLCSLRKQVHALTKQKLEQEKKAADVIVECDSQHDVKIKAVKELYEAKLKEQTEKAAELMKEKVRIECVYEADLHSMTEKFKAKLTEKKQKAQQELEVQAFDNVEAEKEYKQVERLQREERVVLHNEHGMEMETFVNDYEQKLNDLNNKIEAIRTDIVGHQDIYDGNVESKASLRAAIQRTNAENHYLDRQKQVCREQIKQIKTELAGRSERVAEQTNALLDLKSKNDELQKWRTVMDFKLTALKKQVEPKAHEIEVQRQRIIENEAYLRQMKVSNEKDAGILENLEIEINILYNAILKCENRCHKCSATIDQFKNHVHRVFTEMDPDCWPGELVKLYHTFVSRDAIEQLDESLRDTLIEFDRHKTALTEKVFDFRLKAEADAEASGYTFMKQIGKNESLMKELAKLRAENRKLKSDFTLTESELNTLLRQCQRGSKQLGTKVKTLLKSTPLMRAESVQRRTTRGGASVLVESFRPM